MIVIPPNFKGYKRNAGSNHFLNIGSCEIQNIPDGFTRYYRFHGKIAVEFFPAKGEHPMSLIGDKNSLLFVLKQIVTELEAM